MPSRTDRIEGAFLALAAGDALGAPYEFQPARGPELDVAMVGGGIWAPGEWTDDTAMAIAIAEVAGTGADLRDEAAQDAIAARWLDWSKTAKDVGIQTRSVLANAGYIGISAASARAEADRLHQLTGLTAGNGSLMRTAPVALAYLDDEAALVQAARMISELTHFDTDAGDACVLWTTAIRHAVLTAQLDIRVGLHNLDKERQALWSGRINEAESRKPYEFPKNGWVVGALQAAWSAIATTPVPVDDPASQTFRAQHLRTAIDAAVRAGNDTDTVAAIAGSLLGAAYGASAVPLAWHHLLHGWPNMRTHDLVSLAGAIARSGRPDHFDPSYPGIVGHVLALHPYDDKLFLGGIAALRNPPEGVDAIVSLCRIPDSEHRTNIPHLTVRLIDRSEPDENPHLDHVILDAVHAVEYLRNQGRTVLLHCVEAYSRTPTVAALYGARLRNISTTQALRDVQAALPHARPNSAFRESLARLAPPSNAST
jgi:ADP-ribosylglycohydrolase/protein-tyrosine phosphatase